MRRWINKLLSKDGEVSFGRVACLSVIAYIMTMTTLFSFKAEKFPSALADIPSGWVYVIGVLWGTQKVSEAIIATKKGGSGDA